MLSSERSGRRKRRAQEHAPLPRAQIASNKPQSGGGRIRLIEKEIRPRQQARLGLPARWARSITRPVAPPGCSRPGRRLPPPLAPAAPQIGGHLLDSPVEARGHRQAVAPSGKQPLHEKLQEHQEKVHNGTPTFRACLSSGPNASTNQAFSDQATSRQPLPPAGPNSEFNTESVASGREAPALPT